MRDRYCLSLILLLAGSSISAADVSDGSPRLLYAQDLPMAVDAAALQRQYESLSRMPSVTVEYSRRGPVHNLDGETGITIPTPFRNLAKGDAANEVVQTFGDLLLAAGTESLIVRSNANVDPRTRVLRLSQFIRGLPVIHGRVAIEYDDATGVVTGLTANFLPDRELPREPKRTAAEAEDTLIRVLTSVGKVRAENINIHGETQLAYYSDTSESNSAHLVWIVSATINSNVEAYFVDAITGAVIRRERETSELTQVVYNTNNQVVAFPSGLTNPLSQPQINADQYARDASDHVQTADTNVRARFPQAAGQLLLPSVVKSAVRYNFSPDPPGAVHNLISGTDYLRFSGPSPPRGTAPSTNSFTAARDVVFHEYAHGIGKRIMGFDGDTYDYQVGALHEGFSDYLTTVIDVAVVGSVTPATWIIANGLFPSNAALGYRSFSNPYGDLLATNRGRDWFPTRYMGLQEHANSGILSHAYYLLINGGLHARWDDPIIPSITVNMLDEVRARDIVFRAFSDGSMDSQPTFLKMKNAAMSAASLFYGSAARTSTQQAFEAVGVGNGCTSAPSSAPMVDFENFQCAGRILTQWPGMPGVNRYIAQITPRGQGWVFALTVTDVSDTLCQLQIPWAADYRIRACNNCGCGPWSATRHLNYWGGTCP